MFHESFRTLFWREFTSIKQGAEYFHVSKPTITRWLDGTVPINPMAEKLLLIKSLGYLPNDIRWSGFRVDEKRAVLITPSGREFSPKELESFVFWRDEHRQFVEMYGHFECPKVYPAKENVLPFRGGRRMKAADWIPSKIKNK
ncbi:phage protein [Vibrio parahaemolyticus]|uniref:phage protein n=1 Tax=Vibrio parahaemolyticus TaxID=670 RepID=UPI0004D48E76|nr:phage protein [Vibrio parahaemolyticus]ODX40561.1 S-adenosylhomocysteine hydrolase [Vibrio parahaemolyticus]ODY92924.1 S-adenosylhomocysteine hydrolase [Vibrio parahaemolyticus]OQT01701.1 S-adenosylhomocysteine hydrolase [Vibrio parahaemolyticus 98-513-F52]PNO30136.1 S-adenosylhomocysteine hydrolase [Vibrio parahaemolyticus]